MDLDDKSLLYEGDQWVSTKRDSWALASTVCHSSSIGHSFARTKITRQQIE